MAKKNLSNEKTMPLAERFRFLCRELFDGNQSKMAAAIDCSQAVISKILQGRQQPGERILARLAAHNNVNREWLYQGTGEPTTFLAVDPEAARWLLPLALSPLPGPRHAHRRLLGTENFAAPPTFFQPSCYWLRIGRDENILRGRVHGILANDLILVESDPKRIQRIIRTTYQQLGVVRAADRKTGTLAEVSLTENDEGPDVITANDFSDDSASRDYVLRIRGNAMPEIREPRMRKSNLRDWPHRARSAFPMSWA